MQCNSCNQIPCSQSCEQWTLEAHTKTAGTGFIVDQNSEAANLPSLRDHESTDLAALIIIPQDDEFTSNQSFHCRIPEDAAQVIKNHHNTLECRVISSDQEVSALNTHTTQKIRVSIPTHYGSNDTRLVEYLIIIPQDDELAATRSDSLKGYIIIPQDDELTSSSNPDVVRIIIPQDDEFIPVD